MAKKNLSELVAIIYFYKDLHKSPVLRLSTCTFLLLDFFPTLKKVEVDRFMNLQI
jgi:hypothetical protein